MKKSVFLIIPILLIAIVSCKKSDTDPSSSGQGKEFKFISLVANDTVLKVNDFTSITATASGEGLSYTWTTDGGFGTFVGSGSKVQWTVCHSDRFKITCVVKDQSNHSESKDVYIRTQE